MGIIVTKPRGGTVSIRKDEAIGDIDGVNKDYETPTDFYPNTLTVYLNGVRERNITITGSKNFQMPKSPRVGFKIDVEYVEY